MKMKDKNYKILPRKKFQNLVKKWTNLVNFSRFMARNEKFQNLYMKTSQEMPKILARNI